MQQVSAIGVRPLTSAEVEHVIHTHNTVFVVGMPHSGQTGQRT